MKKKIVLFVIMAVSVVAILIFIWPMSVLDLFPYDTTLYVTVIVNNDVDGRMNLDRIVYRFPSYSQEFMQIQEVLRRNFYHRDIRTGEQLQRLDKILISQAPTLEISSGETTVRLGNLGSAITVVDHTEMFSLGDSYRVGIFGERTQRRMINNILSIIEQTYLESCLNITKHI